MHKEVVIEAFLKAKENEEKKGIRAPSNHRLSIVLSAYITEEMKFSFGERSLKNYYNDALEFENTNEDINISHLKVLNGLCKYLGYINYEDYVLSQKKDDHKEEDDITYINEDGESTTVTKIKSKRLFAWFSNASAFNKFLLLFISTITLVIIIFTIGIIIGEQTRWMVWQEDHYVEVDFDTEKYKVNQLKLYKEDRINLFKKVSTDCSETKFFNNDGSVNIWYGKNKNKELEYFTDLGLHPETGKTLKPITQYMINKYICN
ncbi:hypothetical protein [Psychroserpens damuponensis]|uniref:hypothetical protein n=1 Tax=Psychroserpens damuponensis TaxID=943936 RepID=UPI00058E20C0|nr:hypothetical protein [Psychroserpens damuponensis]